MSDAFRQNEKKAIFTSLLTGWICFLFLFSTLYSATITKANNSTVLSTGASWVGGSAPGVGDIISFDSTLSSATTAQVGAGGTSVLGIQFTNPANDFSITANGANALNIGANGVSTSGGTKRLFLNSFINMTANQSWSIGSGQNIGLQTTANNFNDGGFTLNLSGAGNFDVRTTNTFGSNVTIGTTAFSVNGAAATVTIQGVNNTFDAFSINSGRAILSTIGDFGTASSAGDGGTSSSILLGGVGGNGVFEYSGTTASSNRVFARDARSVSSGIDITNAGTTLTLTGNMNSSQSNSGTNGWVFGGAGNLTLAGPVSNSTVGGSTGTTITKNGAGTLMLTGTSNNYSGATTVNGGNLKAGAANTFGSSSAVSLANTAGVALDLNGFDNTVASLSGGGTTGGNVTLGSGTLTTGGDNTSTSFGGAISGTGGFTKNGTGTFTVTNTGNTYSGTTTVGGGIVKAGAANTLSSSSAVSLANTVGVALDLNGFDNTVGSLSGGGTTGGNVTLGSGTLTTGGDNTSTTYAGVLSGTGGLIKTGSGTQILTGTHTTTGIATINGGILSIGTSEVGSWAGNVIANSGATLKGRGTISGSVTVNSGGTYSPGNSPGVQTVGSLTLNSGSNTILEIDGSTAGNGARFHDQIIVTGAATINSGATLTPQTIFSGSTGFSPTQGQKFTVISAGSLTGQFSTIDNSGNPARLTFLPVYSSTELNLFAVYSSLAGSLTNLNPNQRVIAGVIDSFQPTVISTSSGSALPDNERIHLAMTGLSDEGLKNVIEQMNPEKLQALPRLSKSVGAQIHYQVGRQLQLRRNLNPAQGDLSVYDRNGQTVYEPVAGVDSGSLFVQKRKWEKLSFFASVNGEQGEVSPSENRTNFDYWSATALYGGSYALTPEWNFGLFAGYGHTDTSLGGSGGDIVYNTGKIGGYAAWNASDWFAEWSLSGGKGAYETRRNLPFLSEKARGDTESWEVLQQLRFGKDLSWGKWTFGPSVHGRYSEVFVDGYDETGSAARLNVRSMNQSSAVSGAGLNIQRAILFGGMSFVPRVYLNYEREWIRSGVIDARFAAGGNSFRVRTDSIDPDQLTTGVGASWVVSDQLQWDLSLEREVLENDLRRQSANLSCKFRF